MVAELLARCDAFADLEPPLLQGLASHVVEVSVPSGRLVFAHGDPGDAVFLVLEGSVTVFRDQVGRPMQLLARVGPNELLGELCLFDEARRTASARASAACRFLRIAREPLVDLLGAQPQLALRIQNAAARRRSKNSAAALDLGQQSEIRIRLRAPVKLRMPSGRELPAQLANLSVGGLSLAGAPDDWEPGLPVRFELLAEGDVLPVEGRVAWRQDDAIGIAFVAPPPGHDLRVYRLLRRLGDAG